MSMPTISHLVMEIYIYEKNDMGLQTLNYLPDNKIPLNPTIPLLNFG